MEPALSKLREAIELPDGVKGRDVNWREPKKRLGFGFRVVVFGVSIVVLSGVYLTQPNSIRCVLSAEDKKTQTPLYNAFDPVKFAEKYGKRFKEVSSDQSVSGLAYDPLGELFKFSMMQGEIAEGDLKVALADMQTELVALAKTSRVKPNEPKSTVGDRPIQLLIGFCPGSDIRTLRGFYLTYEGGAIDVFASKRIEGGKLNDAEWRITCMLHEKK